MKIMRVIQEVLLIMIMTNKLYEKINNFFNFLNLKKFFLI